jgi:hypothetical protein
LFSDPSMDTSLCTSTTQRHNLTLGYVCSLICSHFGSSFFSGIEFGSWVYVTKHIGFLG